MVMTMFVGSPFSSLLANAIPIQPWTAAFPIQPWTAAIPIQPWTAALSSHSWISNLVPEKFSVAPTLATYPLLTALFASMICVAGLYFLLGEAINIKERHKERSINTPSARQFGVLVLTILTVFFVTTLITGSKSIAGAISSLSTAIPFMINKHRAQARIRSKDLAWPEAIDSLVSALQSGLSIADSLIGLAERGPLALRESFVRIRYGLLQGDAFEQVLMKEKVLLNSAISDQVFETLVLAKDFGGRDSNNALRLLAEFIREDLDVVEEIRTKFGWIRNSAALATAAPWILLILLSSQSSTVMAFSTSAGIQVLSLGVALTAIAYIWMERVGTLPQMARALR
jgi:tight adherence protein B